MRKVTDGSLYLVLSEEYGNGKPLESVAGQAIAGGIDILQMREKHKSPEELLSLGRTLADLCRRNNVTFIANDDPLLAAAIDADGVHLGQDDLRQNPVKKVRQLIGRDRIIGLSTHSPEQCRQACELDIDYVAFGPVFPTRAKDYAVGTGEVQDVLKLARKPVVFIGGVNTANLNILLNQGATSVALISDIMQADDVTARARWYKDQLKKRLEDGR